MCICIHVYVCMHNILGGIVRGEMSYPKREGELSYTRNCMQRRQRETNSLISSTADVKANEHAFGQRAIIITRFKEVLRLGMMYDTTVNQQVKD